MTRTLPNLEQWLQQMTGRQLPAFARTAQRIASRSLDADSSTGEMAALILQDVSMTTRLLRMANGVLFNPGGGRISTVSRAIIVLGFDTVRDICLSIAVIDGLLSGANRHLVAREMGLALHAALQARNLAQTARLADAEEVFVATLLSHLGELALMCFAGNEHAELLPKLAALHRLPAEQRPKAEVDLLGFALRDLTARLNREWRLSGLLGRALDGRTASEPRALSVHYGNALASCLTQHETGEQLDRLLEEIGAALHIPAEALRQSVLTTFHGAADAGRSLGVDLGSPPAAEHTTRQAAPRWNAGDPALQMAVLRELSQLLVEQRPSASAMMELILEGLFRGVGLDRVVFALLDSERRVLRQKAVLDVEGTGLSNPFEFAARPAEANPLAWSLAHDEPLWLGGPTPHGLPTDATLQRMNDGRCLIMPLAVSGTPIGCLYGDRAASGRPLDEELFAQFRLFGQQARLGLAQIRGR